MTTIHTVFPEIEQTINELNPSSIVEERKKVLQSLIEFIQSKVSIGEKTRINFICTHNSRRSHLSQVWAQTMASYFTIPMVFCYSGGTKQQHSFQWLQKY